MRRLTEEGRPMVVVGFFWGGEGEDEGKTSYFPLQMSHFTRSLSAPSSSPSRSLPSSPPFQYYS